MEDQAFLHHNDSYIRVSVLENVCFCNDTGDFRSEVLLANQGGRKTTASRILKNDGRLWNLPIPSHLELMFDRTGQPLIYAKPKIENNLENLTQLCLYRKSLLKDRSGITFDLTKSKDLRCALPYKTYPDAQWHFLFAFRHVDTLETIWVQSKEFFLLKRGPERVHSRSRSQQTKSKDQRKPATFAPVGLPQAPFTELPHDASALWPQLNQTEPSHFESTMDLDFDFPIKTESGGWDDFDTTLPPAQSDFLSSDIFPQPTQTDQFWQMGPDSLGMFSQF